MKYDIDAIELFLMDMDGTVYIGGQPIEGAFETIDTLKSMGKRVCYLSNNSSRSTSEYIEKLDKMGIKLDSEDLITSIHATIHYIKKHHRDDSVYLVGVSSVIEEFKRSGINIVDDNADIVVLSFDVTLDYNKITKLVNHVERGALYIATHPDAVCPYLPYNLVDVGAMIAMIETATGKRPSVICGKPETAMAEYISDRFGLPSSKIAMCGDRLYTDIQFGINNNYTSILVLSGETSMELYNNSETKATIVLDSFRSILQN